jgi:hypothetical protein
MSGAGPIIIFDKSTLQSLSADEAVWLDAFYYPNITPLFFVETLADLDKEMEEGRLPEQVVGKLAEKTPTGGHPNLHHEALCANELLGHPVEMRRVPAISGGEPVIAGGRRGIVVEEPTERAALRRWESRQFLEVERDFARAWRRALSGLDLDAIFRQGREIIARAGRPKDLSEAKAKAEALIGKRGSLYTREALGALRCPGKIRRAILARWNDAGRPPLNDVAPYTAHVLTVDLFFCIALGADMISRDRPSNKVDIAYLYYLPFCMVFTSNDNLHLRTAPLFLRKDQVFIRGQELKHELARLDAHYSTFPDEVKERGVMSFAHYPPTEGDFLTSKLWDQLMRPGWRQNATRPEAPLSAEAQRELFDQLQAIRDAPRVDPRVQFTTERADAVVIERKVPLRRGKWRLLPPEVVAEASDTTQRLRAESPVLERAERLRDAILKSKLCHPDPWGYAPKARAWAQRAQEIVDTIATSGDTVAHHRALDAFAAEVEGDSDFQEARRLF